MEKEDQPIPIIKRQGNQYGKLYFDKFKMVHNPAIIDYFQSGWNLTFSVAIDFSLSNGEFSDPGSLHFIDSDDFAKKSPYEEVLTEVGSILQWYTADNKIPALGFGARTRLSSRTMEPD